MLSYILWNPSVELTRFFGITLRWYSLCWCIGLLLAYWVVQRLYKRQGLRDELFDPLFMYCLVGILVGARLGHCLFYQPDYFLAHPVEMFLPIRITDGGWHYVGYEGLASHGGTLGLMLALWLYVRKTHIPLWQVLDNIAIATPVTACFIRLGNLMNSEIVGKATDVAWAFVFVRNGDGLPRHPAQLYEAMAYFLFFLGGWWLYRRYSDKVGTGFFFGYCLTAIFTFRFFIEYVKDVQVDFEQTMWLNMGQLLSIPFVLLGAYCLRRGWQKKG